MLTGLLVAAWVQTRYWRDSISLWTHTLACGSGNFLAHNNLGLALAAQGKVNEAIPHYEQALELRPDCAEAHSGLGIALNQQGKLDAAIPHFERARQLNPGSAEAHNNLGAALAAQEKWSAAIPHYERALQLKPDFAEAHYNLGVALATQGKLPEAIQHFQQALNLATAQNNDAMAEAARTRIQSYRSPAPQPHTP
jgi:tetratricopeptide (TPR) repeat protein